MTKFFRAAAAPCWNDPDYSPAAAGEIKTLLTYCVRGERFCDGHWAAMIEEGHVRRLLERLADIRAQS